MFLILGLALLPLGIIAVLGSLQAAMTSRASDRIEAQSVLAVAAQRLSSTFTEVAVTIRVASGAVTEADPDAAARACDRAAVQLAQDGEPVRFALYGPGKRLVCRTQGYVPPDLPMLPPAAAATVAAVDPQGQFLRLTLFDPASGAQGQVELPSSLLREVARPEAQGRAYELELNGEGGTIGLYDNYAAGAALRDIGLSSELLGGRLELRLRAAAPDLTPYEIIMMLLPVLLWLLAALIGWLVVDRLLLRPLTEVARAISAYRPGDRNFEPPAARSPAREIAELGEAFDQVTRTVARHEADLEAAVDRQTRLVREVHHRVKNNLQVVASLLNIHARGSQSEEVASAYASIQRRVDALAVVHRNHYAELEATPGVALRSLISELCASLRASAPAGVSGLQIRLALEPVYVNQDVAVSVAFLITEAVEFAMLCGGDNVAISLEPDGDGRALLAIETGPITDESRCGPGTRERFERIMTGLARQLRATPERDPDVGRFALTVPIVASARA